MTNGYDRNGLSDQRAISMITEDYEIVKEKSLTFYRIDNGRIITLKFSKFHPLGHNYWYGITPNHIEKCKQYNAAFIGFIIGFEGLIMVPSSILYDYVTYADISQNKKNNGRIVHYHVRIKFTENNDITLYNREQRFDLTEYFLPFNNEDVIDAIGEIDIERLLREASAFKDYSTSYRTKSGEVRIRNESRAQKERIAKIENYTCQLCGYMYEFINKKGNKRYIIEVDHIKDKATEGGETMDNLIVLCPNCHAKKTKGAIKINKSLQKIFEGHQELLLVRDSHLGWKK